MFWSLRDPERFSETDGGAKCPGDSLFSVWRCVQRTYGALLRKYLCFGPVTEISGLTRLKLVQSHLCLGSCFELENVLLPLYWLH